MFASVNAHGMCKSRRSFLFLSGPAHHRCNPGVGNETGLNTCGRRWSGTSSVCYRGLLSLCGTPWYPCMWPGVHFLLFSQPPATDKPIASEALDPPKGSVAGEGTVTSCGVAPPSKAILHSRLLLPAFIHLLSMACTSKSGMTHFPLSLEKIRWSNLLFPPAGMFLPEPLLVSLSVLLLCGSQLLDLSIPVKTGDSSSLFISGFYYNTEVIYG